VNVKFGIVGEVLRKRFEVIAADRGDDGEQHLLMIGDLEWG
jgi:hypothetical protein